MEIPFLDPQHAFAADEAAWLAALRRIGRSGRFILGEEVAAFEREAAAWLGAAAAVGVASGTDALILALQCAGIGPGDEVITSPWSFFASAGAILKAGARPRFADIEPDFFTLDPAQAEAAITPATRALLPVHLYGCPADMTALGALARPRGLALIEDCAQSFGASRGAAKTGALSLAGAFSFYPTKILAAAGDGGLIAFAREEMAATARALRNHGSSRPLHHEQLGTNSRLDEIQAALLRLRLARIEQAIARRIEIAALYARGLSGLPGIVLPGCPPGARHVFNLYVIRVARGRDALCAALKKQGIACGVYYPRPLHLQPALQDLGCRAGDFPQAERAAREALALPIFPSMSSAQVARVCEAVAGFLYR